MYKIARIRTTFGSCHVEKWHAAMARSTFASQNTKKLTALLEVQMSKHGTPLWREAHLQVKMLKNSGFLTTFGSSDVEKLHAAVARSAFPTLNVRKMRGSAHFLKRGRRKIAEKWHAAAAPSIFTSQNVKNTCVLHHFWRFRCRRGERQKR